MCRLAYFDFLLVCDVGLITGSNLSPYVFSFILPSVPRHCLLRPSQGLCGNIARKLGFFRAIGSFPLNFSESGTSTRMSFFSSTTTSVVTLSMSIRQHVPKRIGVAGQSGTTNRGASPFDDAPDGGAH